MKDNYLVSIFIPVYNGEKYLTDTLQSIVNQTYTNLEILLVDDSSTDNTINVLQNFASRDKRIRVFQKENGGTVPKSFNFIIPYITGEFFFYSSQDDLFSPDLIEKMVERQILTKSNTVLPDMEFYFEGKDNKKIIGLQVNRTVVLSGKEALIASLHWKIHGFALFQTDLLKDEFFPEDAYDSDEYVTRKMFLKSNKVVFSEGVFFYRQDNSEAITKSFSKKNFYTLNTHIRLYNLLKKNNIEKKIIFEYQFVLLRMYLRLVNKSNSFTFASYDDKKEILTYLSQFKKDNFIQKFYLENMSYAVKKGKVKFIILIVLFQMPLFSYLYNKMVKNVRSNSLTK